MMSSGKSKRVFTSGASRDSDEGKLDFDGFLCPNVLESFAEYMHENRKLKDGSLRNSDNWKKGIPKEQYVKSMWRHFHSVWKSQQKHPEATVGKPTREYKIKQLNALLFNVMGLLHEELKSS